VACRRGACLARDAAAGRVAADTDGLDASADQRNSWPGRAQEGCLMGRPRITPLYENGPVRVSKRGKGYRLRWMELGVERERTAVDSETARALADSVAARRHPPSCLPRRTTAATPRPGCRDRGAPLRSAATRWPRSTPWCTRRARTVWCPTPSRTTRRPVAGRRGRVRTVPPVPDRRRPPGGLGPGVPAGRAGPARGRSSPRGT